MYVCICNGLTERHVRDAALETGERRRAKAVYSHLGCSAKCGLCLNHARKVISDAHESLPEMDGLGAAL